MTKDKNIFIKNIYYMLAYAFSALNQGEFEYIAKEKFDNIHNLFAAILSSGVDRLLKQGLYREYINRTESLTTVRGKIDMSGTIKNQLVGKRAVSCEFDELSENNLFNRIIKATSLLLIKCPDVEEKYLAALKRELMFFSGVDSIEPKKIPWQSVRCQRNNSTYRMLLGICRLTVEGMLQTTESGEYRLATFIKDPQMSRLYEKFILEFYRLECPQVRADPSQIKWALDSGSDGENLPQMRSDIMLTSKDGRRVLIIDAKYYTKTMQEQFGAKTVRSGHLYQIFAYVKNKDAEFGDTPHTVSGTLLYASTDEDFQPNNEYSLNGNKISAKTLDLNREFSEIARQLKALAREHFGESRAE